MYRTRYLVDTDVIINYLKGENKSKDFRGALKLEDAELIEEIAESNELL